MVHLLRNLINVEARFGFCLAPKYINTHANHLADDLSRDNLSSFLLKVPQAYQTPSLVPAELVDLLLDQQAKWTSQPCALSVQLYFRQGLAESTQKSYGAAMKRFEGFCDRFNVLTPFPITEYTMYSFAAYLADQGLAPQTIKMYLAAMRNMQRASGPTRPLLSASVEESDGRHLSSQVIRAAGPWGPPANNGPSAGENPRVLAAVW